jgi:type II secretory pathway component PulM
MTLKVTPRDKKFLIVGGAFVCVYLLTVWVIQPIQARQKQVDLQIQNKIQFIQKYYEILNQKPYYQSKDQDNKRHRVTLTRKFLNETQPGLAAAGLQKMINGYAAQSGVKIERVRVEKAKVIENMPAVPIGMTLRSNLKNLSQFIFRLENSEKFLLVEEIVTRRTNKSDPEELQTRILINGFIQELKPEGTPKI